MLMLMLIFTACSSSKEKLNEQIAKTEKEISQQYDTVKMRQLVELYQEYVQEFPKDSLSGEYLFRSGSLNMTLGKGADASPRPDFFQEVRGRGVRRLRR